MTLTRWKVMAGTLGVSLCGLAAVADSPKPPVPVPAPAVAELPTIPTPPATPAAPTIEPPPVLVPAPTVAAAPPALEPAPAPKSIEIELRLPESAPEPKPTIIPAAAFEPARPESSPPVPSLPSPVAPLVSSAPTPVLEPTPTPAVLTVAPTTPAPVVTPASAVAPAQTPVVNASTPTASSESEKKLRVTLNMGEDRPRFEVKDGEETLLRLVSDRVDVKCPEPGDPSAQSMRAVGAVTFLTPGGEGQCDELTLVPGTGQVVVTGKVKFRYHWGKVETEVAGDRMTFKLGTGPAAVVPAGYSR